MKVRQLFRMLLCLVLMAGLMGCTAARQTESSGVTCVSSQQETSQQESSACEDSSVQSSQASSVISGAASYKPNPDLPKLPYDKSYYLAEQFGGQDSLATWLAGDVNDPRYTELFALWKHYFKLTDEQMVSMMFFVTPEQLLGSKKAVTAADAQAVRKALQARPVGGLAFFAQNLTDPEQTRALLSVFDEQASALELPPLFFGVDEEGGRVSRVANHSAFGITPLPAASALQTAQQAYLQGKTIGGYLKSLGFNLNFAPVADLSNDASSVLNARTFSGDPATVRGMAQQMAKGLREAGVLSTYKHFPGHGATAQDTHTGAATVGKTLSELEQSDLIPYLSGQLTGDTDAVMLGHFACPAVTGSQTLPCSLSKKTVELLRGTVNFHGLIITDGLGMNAVSDHYSSGDAALMAVRAGVDLLLIPKDFDAAYKAVAAAMKTDDEVRRQVFDSVYRILQYKMSLAK